ncbi:MAG: serine hydrolase domain-containing protein [Bacteroidota bacterium]
MKFIVFLLTALTALMMTAQSIDQDALNTIINTQLEENDPGLFVGVIWNGEIVFESVRGLSSLQHSVQATVNTKSNVASVAKQFTALCVLKLSLEGTLNLEDDIRKYLPTLYTSEEKEIKIRHLINHTSGIRDYSDLMSLQQETWWRREGLDNEDVFALLERQNDLNFDPGTAYLYSNSNYTLLTKIVEIASGQSFHDYSKKLFEELGMTDTEYLKNYMYVMPNQAFPYMNWGNGIWQQYPMITNLFGDGFLFTTLRDQLVFEQAIQNAENNNNQLLILSQQPIKNSEITTYGFGLELEDRLNYPSLHHSGSTGSYHAQVLRFPEEKLSIFVMSNNGTLSSGNIAYEIAEVLLPKKELKADSHNPLQPEIVQAQSELKDLIGYYRTPKGTLIRITEKDKTLYYQYDNNNPFKLIRKRDNLFSFEGIPNTHLAFTYNGNERDNFTLYQEDSEPRVHLRSNDLPPTAFELEAYVGTYYNSELDISFEVYLENDLLMVLQQWRTEAIPLRAFTKKDLLLSNYRTTLEPDAFGRVKALLLTSSRVKNVRFVKKESSKFQPKIPTENGSINVSTIKSIDGRSSQILLTKNYENGNEIWSKQYGGKAYEQAKSIIQTKDGGYLIVGATSSFGNGNYDAYVIKVDHKGKEQWSNSYGDFYNEYGYTAEETQTGYLIKGSKQYCSSNSDVFNRVCTNNVWLVYINKQGEEVSNEVREEL